MYGTSQSTVLPPLYPDVKWVIVSGTTNIDLFDALRDGECKGAVITASDWHYVNVWAETNPNCNLVQVGSTISSFSGSWPFLNNYETSCSFFLGDVISAIIIAMKTDGTYDDLVASRNSLFSNAGCSTAKVSKAKLEGQLGINNMAGRSKSLNRSIS